MFAYLKILFLVLIPSLSLFFAPQETYALSACLEDINDLFRYSTDDDFKNEKFLNLKPETEEETQTPLLVTNIYPSTENLIKVLLHIRNTIPSAISDPIKYKFSALAVIDKSLHILAKLKRHPEYFDLLKTVKRKLLDISISKSSHTSSETLYSSDSLFAFKEELTSLLLNFRPPFESDNIYKDLISMIQKDYDSLQGRSTQATFSGLLSGIDKNLKPQFIGKGLNETLSLLKTILPDYIPWFKTTEGEGISKNEILKTFGTHLSLELSFEKNFLIFITLKALNPKKKNLTFENALDLIEEMQEDDIAILFDTTDFVMPMLTNSFPKMMPQKSTLLNKVLKNLHKRFKLKTKTHHIQARNFLMEEVDPLESLMRGCIAHDCSTQMSAPYGLAPLERIFYIKNLKTNAYVGYLQGVQGQVKDVDTFYVHTINGTDLKGSDISMILEALFHAKENFGVTQLALPQNMKDLINSEIHKKTLEQWIVGNKNTRGVFTFLDKNLRLIIEREFNNKYYDKMNHLDSIYLINKALPHEISTKVSVSDSKRVPFILNDGPITTDVLLSLALDFALSGNDVKNELNTFYSLGLNENVFLKIKELLSETPFISIKTLKRTFHQNVAPLKIDSDRFLKDYSRLFTWPLLNCYDAFSKENEQEGIKAFFQILSGHLKKTESLKLGEIFFKNISLLQNSNLFTEELKVWFESLSTQGRSDFDKILDEDPLVDFLRVNTTSLNVFEILSFFKEEFQKKLSEKALENLPLLIADLFFANALYKTKVSQTKRRTDLYLEIRNFYRESFSKFITQNSSFKMTNLNLTQEFLNDAHSFILSQIIKNPDKLSPSTLKDFFYLLDAITLSSDGAYIPQESFSKESRLSFILTFPTLRELMDVFFPQTEDLQTIHDIKLFLRKKNYRSVQNFQSDLSQLLKKLSIDPQKFILENATLLDPIKIKSLDIMSKEHEKLLSDVFFKTLEQTYGKESINQIKPTDTMQILQKIFFTNMEEFFSNQSFKEAIHTLISTTKDHSFQNIDTDKNTHPLFQFIAFNWRDTNYDKIFDLLSFLEAHTLTKDRPNFYDFLASLFFEKTFRKHTYRSFGITGGFSALQNKEFFKQLLQNFQNSFSHFLLQDENTGSSFKEKISAAIFFSIEEAFKKMEARFTTDTVTFFLKLLDSLTYIKQEIVPPDLYYALALSDRYATSINSRNPLPEFDNLRFGNLKIGPGEDFLPFFLKIKELQNQEKNHQSTSLLLTNQVMRMTKLFSIFKRDAFLNGHSEQSTKILFNLLSDSELPSGQEIKTLIKLFNSNAHAILSTKSFENTFVQWVKTFFKEGKKESYEDHFQDPLTQFFLSITPGKGLPDLLFFKKIAKSFITEEEKKSFLFFIIKTIIQTSLSTEDPHLKNFYEHYFESFYNFLRKEDSFYLTPEVLNTENLDFVKLLRPFHQTLKLKELKELWDYSQFNKSSKNREGVNEFGHNLAMSLVNSSALLIDFSRYGKEFEEAYNGEDILEMQQLIVKDFLEFIFNNLPIQTLFREFSQNHYPNFFVVLKETFLINQSTEKDTLDKFESFYFESIKTQSALQNFKAKKNETPAQVFIIRFKQIQEISQNLRSVGINQKLHMQFAYDTFKQFTAKAFLNLDDISSFYSSLLEFEKNTSQTSKKLTLSKDDLLALQEIYNSHFNAFLEKDLQLMLQGFLQYSQDLPKKIDQYILLINSKKTPALMKPRLIKFLADMINSKEIEHLDKRYLDFELLKKVKSILKILYSQDHLHEDYSFLTSDMFRKFDQVITLLYTDKLKSFDFSPDPERKKNRPLLESFLNDASNILRTIAFYSEDKHKNQLINETRDMFSRKLFMLIFKEENLYFKILDLNNFFNDFLSKSYFTLLSFNPQLTTFFKEKINEAMQTGLSFEAQNKNLHKNHNSSWKFQMHKLLKHWKEFGIISEREEKDFKDQLSK